MGFPCPEVFSVSIFFTVSLERMGHLDMRALSLIFVNTYLNGSLGFLKIHPGSVLALNIGTVRNMVC